jgi:hypothetical protein
LVRFKSCQADAKDQNQDLQIQRIGRPARVVVFEPPDPVAKEFWQRRDVFAAGKENQEAIENVERGYRDDDRRDAQPGDEKGVDRPAGDADRTGGREHREPAEPVADRQRQCDILRHRRRCGEGNVDATGNQHYQQARGQDADESVGGEEVEQILKRQKAVGRERQRQAKGKNHGQQPEFVTAAKPLERGRKGWAGSGETHAYAPEDAVWRGGRLRIDQSLQFSL